MAMNVCQVSSLFEVRFVDQAAGCERPHTHTSLVISAVSGGDVSLQINNINVQLKDGMVVAVGPNILHCVCDYSSDFQGIYVLEILDKPLYLGQHQILQFQFFKSRLQHDSQVYNGFIDLCQTLLSPLTDAEKIARYSNWIKDFFDVSPASNDESSRRHLALAIRIREILDEHEGEEIAPLHEISQTCGFSKERCNRIFRHTYNISIQGYFLNKKASHARALLTSDQTLSDIALQCGFYDQSHLSRIFKEIFQISPSKYRTLIAQNSQSHTRKSS